MAEDKWKTFLLLYVSIIMPALLLLLAAITAANILWFILLFSWFGTGLLIILIPTATNIKS